MSKHYYKIDTLDTTIKRISFYITNSKSPQYITTKQFINLLTNTEFCDILVESLNKCGFTSYMIKSSIINNKSLDTPFTIIVTKTTFANKVVDYSAFGKQLANDKKHFQVFTSLSGNTLIVPSPKYGEKTINNWQHYHNISGFLKYASSSKVYLFWKYIKLTLQHQLNNKKAVILRTIGHHIPYFHLRIEYHHA